MPKVSKKTASSTGKQTKERPVHPYSRKALKMGKQILHDKKIEFAKSNQSTKLELLTEKLLWFQTHLDDRKLYTKQDMIDLLMQYRDRFHTELEQINIVQNVGNRQVQSKQHFARESAIKITVEDETNQFESSGIEVPDLINKKHLEIFKKWDGDPKYIQNLKLRKLSVIDVQKLNAKSEQIISIEVEKPEQNNERKSSTVCSL